MKLSEMLYLKYPKEMDAMQVVVEDAGEGQYIKEWNIDAPKPDQATLDQWAIELEQEYIFKQNREANESIYLQLDAIDLKSIRALRTNDAQRLEGLEQEAIVLRSTLLPVE